MIRCPCQAWEVDIQLDPSLAVHTLLSIMSHDIYLFTNAGAIKAELSLVRRKTSKEREVPQGAWECRSRCCQCCSYREDEARTMPYMSIARRWVDYHNSTRFPSSYRKGPQSILQNNAFERRSQFRLFLGLLPPAGLWDTKCSSSELLYHLHPCFSFLPLLSPR